MTVGKGKKAKSAPAKSAPWKGPSGLADDIGYYGLWICDEAQKRIGHLYPTAITADGQEKTVAAWLWARTVPCQNPACGMPMPLMKAFQLSKKVNSKFWTKPLIDRESKTISFVIQSNEIGVPSEPTVGESSVTCISCGSPSEFDYVRDQAQAGKMGHQMISIVTENKPGKSFVSPNDEHIRIAAKADPQ